MSQPHQDELRPIPAVVLLQAGESWPLPGEVGSEEDQVMKEKGWPAWEQTSPGDLGVEDGSHPLLPLSLGYV